MRSLSPRLIPERDPCNCLHKLPFWNVNISDRPHVLRRLRRALQPRQLLLYWTCALLILPNWLLRLYVTSARLRVLPRRYHNPHHWRNVFFLMSSTLRPWLQLFNGARPLHRLPSWHVSEFQHRNVLHLVPSRCHHNFDGILDKRCMPVRLRCGILLLVWVRALHGMPHRCVSTLHAGVLLLRLPGRASYPPTRIHVVGGLRRPLLARDVLVDWVAPMCQLLGGGLRQLARVDPLYDVPCRHFYCFHRVSFLLELRW